MLHFFLKQSSEIGTPEVCNYKGNTDLFRGFRGNMGLSLEAMGNIGMSLEVTSNMFDPRASWALSSCWWTSWCTLGMPRATPWTW